MDGCPLAAIAGLSYADPGQVPAGIAAGQPFMIQLPG